jgi:hypothetical protein
LAASSSRLAAAKSGLSAISGHLLRDQAPQVFDALDHLLDTEQPRMSPHPRWPTPDRLILAIDIRLQSSGVLASQNGLLLSRECGDPD